MRGWCKRRRDTPNLSGARPAPRPQPAGAVGETGAHGEGWDCWGREGGDVLQRAQGRLQRRGRQRRVLACEVCAFPRGGEVFPLLKQKFSGKKKKKGYVSEMLSRKRESKCSATQRH